MNFYLSSVQMSGIQMVVWIPAAVSIISSVRFYFFLTQKYFEEDPKQILKHLNI